jgi:hypothetical protein
MSIITLEKPFMNLSDFDLEEMIDGFILDTEKYEKEMSTKNKIISLQKQKIRKNIF